MYGPDVLSTDLLSIPLRTHSNMEMKITLKRVDNGNACPEFLARYLVYHSLLKQYLVSSHLEIVQCIESRMKSLSPGARPLKPTSSFILDPDSRGGKFPQVKLPFAPFKLFPGPRLIGAHRHRFQIQAIQPLSGVESVLSTFPLSTVYSVQPLWNIRD